MNIFTVRWIVLKIMKPFTGGAPANLTEAPWIISIKKPRTGVQHLFILIGIYKNGQKPAQKQYNGFISS